MFAWKKDSFDSRQLTDVGLLSNFARHVTGRKSWQTI